MPTVLVPLAQGCEEMEAVILIDILRRAGLEVVTASLDGEPIKASRGVTLLADAALDEMLERRFDLIVLPGGLPGADYLNQDPRILQLLQDTTARGGYAGAICAAPKVLASAGLLSGKQATSYPGVLDKMDVPGMQFVNAPIIQDGQVLTSRGPGTAMDFALSLVALLCGEAKREQVEAALVRP